MGILHGPEVPGCELDGNALAVVEALLAARVAWRSPAHLMAATGLDEAAVFCALADLEVADLVTHWETDAELTVTLTPIGAKILGVRLIELGRNEVPRWAPIASPEPHPPAARGTFSDYTALAFVPSRDLGPEEALELAEMVALADAGGGARVDGDRRPAGGRPPASGLVGAGDRFAPGEPCPACGAADRRGACAYCQGHEARTVGQLNWARRRNARRGARAREARRARLKARFS